MGVTLDTRVRQRGPKKGIQRVYIVHYHDGRVRRKQLSEKRAGEFEKAAQVKEIYLEAPNDDSHKRPERPESPGGNPGVGEDRPDRPESPGEAVPEDRPEPRPERPESPGEVREDEEAEEQPKTTPPEGKDQTSDAEPEEKPEEPEKKAPAKRRAPAKDKQRAAAAKDK
jgi:hypothetical protein